MERKTIAPNQLEALLKTKCRIRRIVYCRTHKRNNFDGIVLNTTLGRAYEVIKKFGEQDSRRQGFVRSEHSENGLCVISHFIRPESEKYDIKRTVTTVEFDGLCGH